MLTNADIAELTDFRRELHRRPELSGQEHQTAARIAALMQDLGADEIRTGIGGTGVVAAFRGNALGPSVMFRAELDALPILEAEGPAHRSLTEGVAHLCGHEGHMTGLAGLARLISRKRPARGTVWLLFQPAEETGAGSAAMLADPGLPAFDYGFAIHNYPGLARNHALIAPGTMNCASVGMKARLTGATSHASEPEKARTPAPAIAAILPALTGLSRGTQAQEDFRLVTITHISMGEPAFGITPGNAEIWVTLRTCTDEGMASLRDTATGIVQDAAETQGLGVAFEWHDDFAASSNHPEATAIFARAAEDEGFILSDQGLPMRASEDFGRFGGRAKTAMILLGCGEDHPPLHAGNYDYPDDLIASSVLLLHRVARDLTS
ncbi:amidohydrolase [Paracoccus aerodenitrificans]|uniref:amidohydrolase n=1 Tax=Paracoccus aerodenitrificans TaxID=3017781 RepID=UPI0022F0FDA0|nr:amidohydrolase [Paracoccus aerodenitrificans]WBU62838.1 amidohydrolase [Paracoccus aerodenitrificans]